MKTISITDKVFLSSLLAKTKTIFISPAWERLEDAIILQTNKKIPFYNKTIPPPHKFGEQIEIIWNKNNKYEWFCNRHGNNIITNYSNLDKDFEINDIQAKNFRFGKECNCTPPNIYHEMDRELFDDLFFNKHLGKFIVKEVYKIEMGKGNENINGGGFYMFKSPVEPIEDTEDYLAKRDGFSSTEQFFDYYNKKFDLSQAKQFWITKGERLI